MQTATKKKAAVAFSQNNTYGPVFLDNSCRPDIFSTEVGRLGLLIGDEMFLPEVARCMMLDGAQMLLWCDSRRYAMTEKVARCRAAENRVFLMRSGTGEDEDNSFIVLPTGAISAATVPKVEQAVSTYCLLAEAYSKTVVPGTDVVRGRIPYVYKELKNTHRKEDL